eukprot:TRINITY_DN453_c0_g1_i2.p2 TRINITY_DN453_c0_g1~~TRINITY_DN453_c0_g1_i2.p2  ORF type:complete len:315 (-),score=39.17 TRINITY_DN453_c0_g1_i2:140-1084(-)
MNNEDYELKLALEASAREYQEKTQDFVPSTTTFTLDRAQNDFPRLSTGNFGTEKLLQDPIFNQFHQHWDSLIKEYETASAICGYITMSIVREVVKFDKIDSKIKLEQLKSLLCNKSVVTPLIRHAMSSIMTWRKKWVTDHQSSFKNKRDQTSYMKAWIANYEISDYVQQLPEEERKYIIFLRKNQWPEYHTATHEEKERLVEEKRFGGKVVCIKGNDKSEYGPDDSTVIVESFYPQRQLYKPEEYISHERDETIAPTNYKSWKVAMMDLNGHFCIAVPTFIDGKRGLLLLNTMDSNGLHSFTVGLGYDLVQYLS